MPLSSAKSCASFFGVALLFLCGSLGTQQVDGANILGMFTSSSPSHLIIHMTVAKTLAERGHNVTVVSTIEPKVKHASIHNIIIPPTEEQEKTRIQMMSEMASQKNNMVTLIGRMINSMSLFTDVQADIMVDKRFTALYENPDTKFDLVILGFFFNDFQLGVAGRFNCPVIVDWSAAPMEMVNNYVGNPRESAYVPTMNIGIKAGEVMNFSKRIQNYLSGLMLQFLKIVVDYRMQGYYSRLFPDDNFPTYKEMKKNVSLLFCNSASLSEGPIRPNVPALVEIGGIQIKDTPDPLPKDIADLLEASKKNGAILFSLGSNVQGSNLKPEIVNIIFKTLSSLKQNVIWKWEDLENTPGKSSNILYKKWLPQDDILAHPNLKLFITHAGKGGITESQYHGVPMVALPVFADQNGNAEKMASSGYGLQLDMLQLQEQAFREAVIEVLSNSTYATNVRKFSQLYRDRPMTAKQNVVFWTEYVLRHHGAAHMQSPLVHMNAIQSANLDVIAVLFLVFYIVWRLLKFVVKFGYRKICIKCNNKNSKISDKKKDKKV